MALFSEIFGSKPSGKRLQRIQQSQNYDRERAVFQNRRPELIRNMNKDMKVVDMAREWFKKEEGRRPERPLPQVRPDLDAFAKASDFVKVIWFGHSTLLMNIRGQNVLVDPVFSNSASPVNFMVKRFQPPVLPLEELPAIDMVLISHDHYDHLDMETVKFFRGKDTRFTVPLGVGSHLNSWGIEPERVRELDWWQSFKWSGIEFTATPAQHFSGRGLTDRDKTLWASWVIRTHDQSIFYSGDSGYDIHFKEIGQRFGPFDLAFIENGQYNERWHPVHMLPEESAMAAEDLNTSLVFPIHWGMFELAFHKWYEPVVDLARHSMNASYELVTPKIGQIVQMGVDSGHPESWWMAHGASIEIAESSRKVGPSSEGIIQSASVLD